MFSNVFMDKILRKVQKQGQIIELVKTNTKDSGIKYIYSDSFWWCDLETYKIYKRSELKDKTLLIIRKSTELSLWGTWRVIK